jgi:hypothetical protein
MCINPRRVAVDSPLEQSVSTASYLQAQTGKAINAHQVCRSEALARATRHPQDLALPADR